MSVDFINNIINLTNEENETSIISIEKSSNYHSKSARGTPMKKEMIKDFLETEITNTT